MNRRTDGGPWGRALWAPIRSLFGQSHAPGTARPGDSEKPRPKRFTKCILHIGTEKTGTTAIQTYLNRERQALHRQKILYPASANDHYGAQLGFVAAIHPTAWKMDIGRAFAITNRQDQATFRRQVEAKLEQEFAQIPGADTLLISSEHFHSRLTSPAMIEALKAMLDPWVEAYQVLVYFRRQDRMAISSRSTGLKSGASHSDDHYLRPIHRAWSPYHYYELYQNWAGVFGKPAMMARLYPDAHQSDKEIIGDFADACAFGVTGPIPTHRPNQSLSREAFHFINALNTKVPSVSDGRQDMDKMDFVSHLAALFPGKYQFASRAEAEAFYAPFREANEKLRTLAFPERPAPLFDEDFSEYPETVDRSAPDYTEAVTMAYTLWRHLRDQQKETARPYTLIDALLRKFRRLP